MEIEEGGGDAVEKLRDIFDATFGFQGQCKNDLSDVPNVLGDSAKQSNDAGRGILLSHLRQHLLHPFREFVLGMLFDLAEVVILDVAVKFVAHKPDDPRNDHLHISILSRILSLWSAVKSGPIL